MKKRTKRAVSKKTTKPVAVLSQRKDDHSNSNVLTASELFTGGDEFRAVTLHGTAKDKKIGMVYLIPPSAGDVIEFIALGVFEKTGDAKAKVNAADAEEAQKHKMFDLIRHCVVNGDGEQAFDSKSDVSKLPIAIYGQLAAAISGMIGEGLAAMTKATANVDGNSSEAQDSDPVVAEDSPDGGPSPTSSQKS